MKVAHLTAAWVVMALAGPAAAQEPASRKAVASGAIKPGVYGRVQVRGTVPPLVHAQPVTVTPTDRKGDPVYLYVPPGQVRRWAQHCAKWDACERPVYFVRVDNSPSRLGAWKKTQRPTPQETSVLHAWSRF